MDNLTSNNKPIHTDIMNSNSKRLEKLKSLKELCLEPILKDGRTIEEVRAENKRKEETQNIINEFYKLLRNEDIRGIRKMLRRNNVLNDLNTRELNEDFPINEYKFVKRNGKLTFIHDFNYHPGSSTTEHYENRDDSSPISNINGLNLLAMPLTSTKTGRNSLTSTNPGRNSLTSLTSLASLKPGDMPLDFELINEFEILKERVNNIYDFCKQVEEYIATLESRNY